MIRGMYVPAHFKPDDDAVRELLRHIGAADLITATADGSARDDAAAGLRRAGRPAGPRAMGRAAGARRAEQRPVAAPPIGEAMVIVRGPDAYISPAWYETKREHGRVVPTWNYITAHVYGRLVIHDDPAWVEANVRRLTAQTRGAAEPSPGPSTTRPRAYIAGQLRAIVGVEIVIDRSRPSSSSARTARTRTSPARSRASRNAVNTACRPPCAISGEVPTRPDPLGAPLQAAECAPVGDAAGDE